MLIAAVADKSHKVRWKAGQIASIYFRKKWLVPFMEQAAAEGKDSEWLPLLRDGYSIIRMRDASYYLRVLSIKGFEWMRICSEAEVKEKGVEALVQEQQSKPFNWTHQKQPDVQVEEDRIIDE